jgi:sialic acid synthase SpsE
MTMRIEIGDHQIGDGAPALVVAEIGYNFTNADEAVASVDAAHACGCGAVKLQTFRAETLATRDVEFPPEAGGGNQFDEFKRFEIPEEMHRRVFERAVSLGMLPFSTPSAFEDVDLLERVGAPLHKIGSDDLTNVPLLRYVAATAKPIILSTGMGTLAEVDRALDALGAGARNRVILLQCVSNYPIRDVSELNLRVLESYRRGFGVLVGLSDHTTSNTAAVAAVALGACVVERHFALDKNMDVPDAFFSADPPEMTALVNAIREVELMLGDGIKRPTETEWAMRRDTRKSLIARRRIAAGQRISEQDVIVKRPSWGIAPEFTDLVVGRLATREIPADAPISWDAV